MPHLIVAHQVRQQLQLDEVLLMPEFIPPHVDKKETIDEYHPLFHAQDGYCRY